MLKRYFISMLGALTAIWISAMLIIVLGMTFAISSLISSFDSSKPLTKIEKNSILCINLSGVIEERSSNPNIYDIINEKQKPHVLGDIIDAIDAARSDRKISGIYINCEGSSIGIASRESIRKALDNFKKSGKWIVSYADIYSQGDYYTASVADEMFLNPVGEVDLRGLVSAVPFFKGLLDKVGVEMQVVKVGTFKSAVEPFILTQMSDANRLQTSSFLGNIWAKITEDISKSRNISVESINQLADSMGALVPAEQLVELKVVDGLKYADEMENFLKGKIGKSEDDDIDLVTIDNYLASKPDIPHAKNDKNKIVVYYAYGDITENGNEGIASDKVAPDILNLAEDDDIDAMVLRVNSGGGSAFASEQIWHAIEVFKDKGKSVYVSMGDVAASGGYYISCGAEKIYAEPTTLTGSIGIFGLIPSAKDLMNGKLGINMDFVQTNKNSAAPNIYEPMTPYQHARMQSMVERGYDLFTRRCAEGRHMSQDSIKAIAEGRVWDGMMAQKIGLVDELGSLNDAIDALAKAKGYNEYQIVNYPSAKESFLDMLMSLDAQMKADALKEELGAYYSTYLRLKEMQEMDPVQARMEQIVIY